MDPEETQQKILDSDEFVISELKKIQTLYELKKVIRYEHTRDQEADTESVAEHIFGMHCLVDYFLPLEDPRGSYSERKIRRLVQYHDIDEIITGDTVGYKKNSTAHEDKQTAINQVIKKLPSQYQDKIRSTIAIYNQQETFEAKFVKAIDKIEPVFHLYNEAGKRTLHTLKTKQEQHMRIKEPFVQTFPTIKRFTEVMNKQFVAEGFYYTNP